MPSIFQKARDPISSYTHFLGAALSGAGLIGMIARFFINSDTTLLTIISCLLFCFSLIALYSASGIYHFSRASAKVLLILRKLDHAMIYVLIAGTYTPLLLFLLPRTKAIVFTAAIWTAAAIGILLKLCWMDAPRWLGTSLYILMGWAILADFSALAALPTTAVSLLAAGGLLYTIGAVIYLFKWPNFSESFGFHELFHIFVILGSVCHYFMIFFFII